MRWLLLGFVFLLVACGAEGSPLADTEWRLVSLGNADAPAEVGGNATAEFTAAGDMNGLTACNFYTAGYSVRGSEGCPVCAGIAQGSRGRNRTHDRLPRMRGDSPLLAGQSQGM